MSGARPQHVILLNSARRWIGEAAHVLDLARGLRARGVAVTLGVRTGHELESRARKAAIPTIAFQFRSRFSPLADSADALRLRRLIGETRAEVLHCHRGKDHWAAALAVSTTPPRTVLIRTRHVVMPMRAHATNRWLMRRATARVIAVSEAARQGLRDVMGDHLTEVAVIRGAVDLEGFHPRQRSDALRSGLFGLIPGEVAIGLVGRIQHVKGQRHFLEAIARLRREQLPAKGIIAGGERTPGRMDALREIARSLGIDQHTVFLGERADIGQVMASLDIGVVASIGSEGSSRVAYEYMASALPVVATRVGVLPEVIKSSETGELCPPGDGQALADALRPLIESSERRQAMGLSARTHVEQRHTVDRWIDQTLAVYSSALESVRL